jgi:hypothetical protein
MRRRVSPAGSSSHIYYIYIKIGEAGFVHCPYCGTRYVYRPWLGKLETDPAGNVFLEDGTAC